MHRRSPVVEALADLSTALGRANLRWYLFGAQAAIAYGSTRVTKDIDVTVEPPGTGAAPLTDTLGRASLEPRVEDVDGFLARTRVLPMVHTPTGIPVDIVLAGPGLEELFLDRARSVALGGVEVPVASPEDVIAMKILAGRPHDMDDALAILRAQPELDVGSVRSTLELLEEALDQSDLVPELESLLRTLGGDRGP